MKKNNDTWLGFFKKILKVSGIILICIIIFFGALISWLIYNEDNLGTSGITYLKCDNRYVSFTNYTIRSGWDGLEKDWNISLDITKINKSLVEAKFKVKDGDAIYIIDRINGTMELKNLTTNESLIKRKCIKISKRDLPKSEITPKF